MSWVRALVYVAFKEGGKQQQDSLYVAINQRDLIGEARKAVDGWIDGLVRLHRRDVSDARISHIEYESPHGWLTITP